MEHIFRVSFGRQYILAIFVFGWIRTRDRRVPRPTGVSVATLKAVTSVKVCAKFR
jgi:hypothetical protein